MSEKTFNEAINSVFEEMMSLTTEELKAEIDKHSQDNRTALIYYAWNCDAGVNNK